MRLDKAVALCGMTRRDARRAIQAGRVRVNGEVARDAGRIVGEGERVTLDGESADMKREAHVMLHKPAGYLTATEDARGDRTVMELLPDKIRARKIGPVGRLDKDVTGLLLLSTDGQLAHRLISPKRDVEKCYLARVEGTLTEDCARAFAEGLTLSDFNALPAKLIILEAGEAESTCRVLVKEGKFHQVKRMLACVKHPVISLKRERIGPVALDANLPEGEWRYLTDEEEEALYRIAGMTD